MTATAGGYTCYNCQVADYQAERNEKIVEATEKRASEGQRFHLKPQIAIGILAICMVLIAIRLSTLNPDFDVEYSLDTSNPLLLGFHCQDLLGYYVNDERAINQERVYEACPPPLVIVENLEGYEIRSPDTFEYGFEKITLGLDPLSLEIIKP